jgi:outer membrane protein assembly factor BamB
MIKRICVSLVALLALSAFSQDTTMFRADPSHTGLYTDAGVPRLTHLKWKFHTKGQVMSSAAIANGIVYFGSTDHNLYALDQQTGALKWKFKTDSRIPSSPAVADGAVFFASYDGYFYALDAATGKLTWKFQTAGEHRYTATHIHGAMPAAEAMPDPFDFYLSSPVVLNGTVYFGSSDGNVYALTETTGKLKWKFHTGNVVHSSPAIADGTLFIGGWDTFFYALDAATGKEKWRFKTGDDPQIHNQVGIQSSPAVANGTVYFGCRDSHFYAVDAHTGKQKWVYPTGMSWVIGSAAIQGNKIYFATSDSGLFHAVNANTGAELYTLKFIWPMFSSPAIAGNMLYIGSHTGKLIAIDLVGQHAVWTFATDGSRENGPKYTNADGTPNYAAAFKDDFYDGMVTGVERMMTVGAILSSPVLSGNAIYFGSMDGNFYALE